MKPIEPDTLSMLWKFFSGEFISEAPFYFVIAGLIWAILHLMLKKRLAHRLIHQWPTNRDLRREILYSLTTIAIFSATIWLMVALDMAGYVVIYQKPDQYGWAWFILSFPVLLIWHDFYFYWTHRLLHSKWLFRHVHSLHHRSRHPSPWAAYAFHPIEALIIVGQSIIIMAVLPFHPLPLLLTAIHQVAHNALNHSAIEVWPKGFNRNWLTRHISTPTHHNLHHSAAQGNYGLWFTWWDKLCRTERAEYMSRFDELTGSPKPASLDTAYAEP